MQAVGRRTRCCARSEQSTPLQLRVDRRRAVRDYNSPHLMVREFVADESGQDVVEYGMLFGSIAMVVLLGGGAFGNTLAKWFNHLAGRITTTGT